MKQILRLTGSTAANTDSGIYNVRDPNYFGGEVAFFRVPIGCKVKIWGITISGDPSTVELEVSHDGSVYVPAGRWDLPANAGVFALTYEGRPEVVLESRRGTECMRLKWSKLTTDNKSNRVTLLVEVSDED
jgi:hypothetical protein